jgi:hypothetical protein
MPGIPASRRPGVCPNPDPAWARLWQTCEGSRAAGANVRAVCQGVSIRVEDWQQEIQADCESATLAQDSYDLQRQPQWAERQVRMAATGVAGGRPGKQGTRKQKRRERASECARARREETDGRIRRDEGERAKRKAAAIRETLNAGLNSHDKTRDIVFPMQPGGGTGPQSLGEGIVWLSSERRSQ